MGPSPQLHLLLTCGVDGLFQPWVVSLGRGLEVAVLRDYFWEFRTFSRWGSLNLPRLCSPKRLPWDVYGGVPCKSTCKKVRQILGIQKLELQEMPRRIWLQGPHSQKNISRIKELLFCASEGLVGAETVISEGQAHCPLGMVVLRRDWKLMWLGIHPFNVNNETSTWGPWGPGNQVHSCLKRAATFLQRDCCFPMGVLAPVAKLQILQEKLDICIFKNLNLLSFNSVFRKYCVCGAKYICKLGVACGLWLSASALNHHTCWRVCQRQKSEPVECSSLGEALPEQPSRLGSGWARGVGEGQRAGAGEVWRAGSWKHTSKCVLASCLREDWGNLQI